MRKSTYQTVSCWLLLAQIGSSERVRAKARRMLLALFLSPGLLVPDRACYVAYYGKNESV